ncbi:putative cell cycle checkpoint protein [Diaporthe ampelina]|uniref:Putative cell cycle checkpoint protein n=1 Tax=Diaporthe ampelina TaxID=1214573 RepID=A0A0G2FZG8_9PEZI|nr:putative cell cycle checkpoint protein [Diaporthe ampelina]
MLGRLQLPFTQTNTSTSSPSPFCWTLAAALLTHPFIFPLVSITTTADLLEYISCCTANLGHLNRGIMKSVKLKSPVKTSVARHEDHPILHDVDPACAICQVDVGTKSPDGIKEGWSITPCGHVFGNVCIKRYLSITDKPLCPVCRTDLFHICSHPILPAAYDRKKSRLTREEAARMSFPGDIRNSDCPYCRQQRLKLARRRRVQEMLEGGPREAAEGRSDSHSDSDSDSNDDSNDDMEGSSTPRTKGLRKMKSLHPEEDEGDENDMADSPQLVPTSNRDLPPVPGAYGYWDVAKKGPDWKFLAFYDSQEPKMNTTADQFS